MSNNRIVLAHETLIESALDGGLQVYWSRERL